MGKGEETNNLEVLSCIDIHTILWYSLWQFYVLFLCYWRNWGSEKSKQLAQGHRPNKWWNLSSKNNCILFYNYFISYNLYKTSAPLYLWYMFCLT